jgi:hypothetical protein
LLSTAFSIRSLNVSESLISSRITSCDVGNIDAGLSAHKICIT